MRYQPSPRATITIPLFGLALIAAATAHASPPPALVWFTVDGVTTSAEIAGTPGSTGNQIYAATFTSLENAYVVTITANADYTNNPVTNLTGTLKFENLSERPRTINGGIDVEICPGVETGSLIGGFAKVTLLANGPGSITCGTQVAVEQPTMDGVPTQGTFFCPFAISTTGSGSLSSDAQFGLPGPVADGPRNFSSIGHRFSFTLSGADTGVVIAALLVKDADGPEGPLCPEDVDGDGDVDGSDLGLIFGNWGQTNPCGLNLVGDVDGDGEVGSSDMLLLLDYWGKC